MILNAVVERRKRRSKDDFRGRHYEASLILQAVSWYLRYPLSYRDIEELFLSADWKWTTPLLTAGSWPMRR
jgi:transposase-like protein